MMKKAIALLMTAMLMASVLVGCGDKGAADGGEPAAEADAIIEDSLE